MQSIVADLTPASECQDHTASPSARNITRQLMRRVHRIPHPTLVTIAKRPSCGRGTMRHATDLGQPTMPHGCGRLARRANRAWCVCVVFAWHVGQISALRSCPGCSAARRHKTHQKFSAQHAARRAADPGPRRVWVPALQRTVKNAAQRPGHAGLPGRHRNS
jgi:hypothetical protein